MSALRELKAEATAQEALARASGHLLKHCGALELVARSHGYGNWRACLAALSDGAAAIRPQTRKGHKMTNVEMKHYENREWNFSLDIPRHWNTFPAVSTNSPYEIIRFLSHEDGVHILIVFRMPYDPQKGPKQHTDRVQEKLTQEGFANFTTSETSIGSRKVIMLDCNKPKDSGIWSVREYFIFDGTLAHALGFGTDKWDEKVDLFDRMAESFNVLKEAPAS